MSDNEIKVLLVEDNPGDAKLVSMMLSDVRGGSFRVEACERLAAGLERMAQGGVDALLLDLSLPDSHGIETFYRAHSASPALPIVLLSNLDDEGIALQAVEMGAQDYLIKGRVDGRELARALRFAVGRHKKQVTVSETGELFVFVGAKGGVGTTRVALNVAACMAVAKKSVIAVELRPSFGTFSQHLRHVPTHNLSNLLALEAQKIGENEISSSLDGFPSGLKVLFGPQTTKEFQEIEPEKAEALLKALTHMADYVIIDLPDVSTRASQVAARHCSFAAVVLDNDPMNVPCAKLVLEQLHAVGVSSAFVKAIVVNRSALLTGLQLGEVDRALGCEVLGAVTPAAQISLAAQKGGSLSAFSDSDSLVSDAVAAMSTEDFWLNEDFWLTTVKLPLKGAQKRGLANGG